MRGAAVAGWVLGLLGLLSVTASLLYLRANYGVVTVAGESMSPTYEPGDTVVYERIGGDEVRRGDLVLYDDDVRYPHAGGGVLRRVVGVGGDRVVCCLGEGAAERLSVNGRALEEPYVRDGVANGTFPGPYDVLVPEGRLFVLGDNRLNARDSRSFLDDRGGTAAESWVRGRVTGDRTGVVLSAVGTLVGLLLAIAGLWGVLAVRAARRRPARFSELWPAHL